ncbi:MAD1L1 isoform 23, partial [Pan troglodytes]
MEDLGENTTVLSTLRSLNNFISQRVEGGSGLDISTSAPGSLQMQYQQSMQREVDRNQELLTRIRQLQEREAGAEEKMQEQLERNRQCQQNLDAASKRLREKEDSLAQAGETINSLKGRISELQWSVMDQEMRVKRLESEKQELQ